MKVPHPPRVALSRATVNVPIRFYGNTMGDGRNELGNELGLTNSGAKVLIENWVEEVVYD